MKKLLWTTVFISAGLLLVACGFRPTPETVMVKETVVVKETVIVKETVLVTKVATKEVTREVVVTATPKPPTPTPEPRVIFQDDFEEEDFGWPVNDGEDSAWFYENGQMHGLLKTTKFMTWSGHPELEVIDDFSLDVDVTQVAGPDNNYMGILFRYQDNNNWYAFWISGDGYYKVHGVSEGQDVDITRWTQVETIRQGQSTTHVRLVVQGPQISAWVNNKLLVVIQDNMFRRGNIYLTVGTSDEPNTHIAFDNLVVTEAD